MSNTTNVLIATTNCTLLNILDTTIQESHFLKHFPAGLDKYHETNLHSCYTVLYP